MSQRVLTDRLISVQNDNVDKYENALVFESSDEIFYKYRSGGPCRPKVRSEPRRGERVRNTAELVLNTKSVKIQGD